MSQKGILPLIYGLMKKTIPDQMDTKSIFTVVILSGFIDGEGNFQVFMDRKYLRAAFHIRLHSDDIALYLKSLVKAFTFSVNTPSPVISITLNKRTSVSVLSIGNIDALYDYLMYFLLDMPFQTRLFLND